jgi:hypothetical protein
MIAPMDRGSEKFSIGSQGEEPQSYGPQARVLNNLNWLAV